MKTCTRCHTEKEDEDFYDKGKDHGTHSWCKSCFNLYCMSRWIEKKKRIIKQFGQKCLDCNGNFHYAVFEFHHLIPSEKEFGWNKLRLFSEVRTQKELLKCVMLCANCHRLRHTTD